MILYCENCGDALYFNPSKGKMECLSCGNLYDAEQSQMVATTEKLSSPGGVSGASQSANETMECNIYTCTACGAELAVNGVESSTFCAYCGQPTIVFSRVSSEAKPKYIIPFSVTKEQAITTIRQRLKKGAFVPKEIKSFDIERVRGIYIPFWLFNIHYADKQYLRGTVGSGKHKKTKYYYREADCNFTNLTLDASRQLNDETSQRLEPYDTHALQSFDIGYLSGFYADRYDMSDEQLQTLALFRAKALFNQEVERTINASSIELLKSAPTYQIHNTEYALFPAWFLTFRYQAQPYTILVNGQTGKVIGAVPYDKPKVTIWFIVIGCIASIISSFLTCGLFLRDGGELDKSIGMILIFIGTMVFLGFLSFRNVKKSVALTRAKETNTFVKERQEGM